METPHGRWGGERAARYGAAGPARNRLAERGYTRRRRRRRAGTARLAIAHAGVVPALGLRLFRVADVEDLETILERRHEHVGPPHFHDMGAVLPIGGPGTDRRVQGFRYAGHSRREVPD